MVRAHGLLSYYRTTELSELTECGQSSCSVHAVDMLLSMTEIASDAVAAAKGSLIADRPTGHRFKAANRDSPGERLPGGSSGLVEVLVGPLWPVSGLADIAIEHGNVC